MDDRRELDRWIREMDHVRSNPPRAAAPEDFRRAYPIICELLEAPAIQAVAGRVLRATDDEVTAAAEAIHQWATRDDRSERDVAAVQAIARPAR